LTYATAACDEVQLAVDTGVLVKTGADVLVCVRHAVTGADLGHLHQAVEQEILHLNDREKSDRTTLAHLESGLIRAFVELQRV
jgi:F-type H+-transporting ATPase subunit epsilon